MDKICDNTTADNKSEKIIELINVTKSFGDIKAADNVSFAVGRGEFVTLLGPSGCGKTTLLRLISGLETPDSGRIMIGGRDADGMPPSARHINSVSQKYSLFPHLDVFGNVAYGLKLAKVPRGEKTLRGGGTKPLYRKYTRAEIKAKTERALAVVGLSGHGSRNVTTLSGGQQQRVAIARAIVLEPEVLLLDEPMGALDPKTRKEMQLELKRLHGELGITFVCVTHDREEALAMSDRIIVISDGAVRQDGSPKEIYDEPSDAFVADFIGESNILRGRMASDRSVACLGVVLPCSSGGLVEGEEADVLIRPEDVAITPPEDVSAHLRGTVVSSVFKGAYYETRVETGGHVLTAQSSDDEGAGAEVGLRIGGVRVIKKRPNDSPNDRLGRT